MSGKFDNTNDSSNLKNMTIDGKLFGTEERFRTQNCQTDNLYSLPKIDDTKSVIFPCATRLFESDTSRLNASSNGPGSYDVQHSSKFYSEYPKKDAVRFGTAPRESMIMKTPSPGAVYQIDKVYFNGPKSKSGLSFGHDSRFAETKGLESSGLFIPKSDTGRAFHIGQKLKMIEPCSGSPGPIYNAHLRKEYPTPAYSFGKNKNDRFKQIGFLPESD